MTVARFAISLESQLARRVRKAAGRQPLSAWLADAADRKLRAEGLLRVVEDWENEHGALTEADLGRVKRKQRPRRAK